MTDDTTLRAELAGLAADLLHPLPDTPLDDWTRDETAAFLRRWGREATDGESWVGLVRVMDKETDVHRYAQHGGPL